MIVLQILKIIGIVLACIVGFVLLLVLLVCFAPIAYKAKVQGENADTEADVSASWIFGFAKAAAGYHEKKVRYRVSICGFPLMKGTLGESEAEALREVLEEEEVQADPKEYEKISQALEKAEEKEKQAEAEKIEKATQKEQEKAAEKAEKEAKKAEKKEADKGKPLKEKIRAVWQSLKEKYEKFQTAKRIFEARATKRALKHVKVELLHILNHLKPRKIAGTLAFGLEDPADTAIVYGNAVPLAEAMSKGALILTPEFYNKGIRSDFIIKGRIFIGYMILCVLRLYLDRDIQKVMKVIRRYLNG